MQMDGQQEKRLATVDKDESIKLDIKKCCLFKDLNLDRLG